jgi:septum formation protein
MTRIVLASTSPARLNLLQQAGLRPEVIPSNVDESTFADESPGDLTLTLATAKAAAVAQQVHSGLVIGCDTLLEVTSVPRLAGQALGKPASIAAAKALWRDMAGQTATLFTGHCVIDTGSGRVAREVGATEIRFATPSEPEIDAYAATGEPLQMAGSFALDGLGAWFVDEISGDYGNVIGVSLPLLRRLFASLGITVTDLWAAEPSS